jgi:hypothetical protein
LRTVTTKRLELARTAALKRFSKNIDQAIIYRATDTVFSSEQLMVDHVSRENERLARVGYKLSKLGEAETAAEAPTWADMLKRYAAFWNAQADKIEERGPFPLRLEGYQFAPRTTAPNPIEICGPMEWRFCCSTR